MYQKQFPQFQFVPVFWMELEDHDFEEIRSLQLFNIENDILSISYNGPDAENKSKSPINSITLNKDIQRVLEEVKAALNTTDFSGQWITPLESAYQSGKSLSDAFGQWMASLLGKYGLILMDPSDAAFKKMAAPVFKKELENTDSIHRLLTEQSSALKSAGYEVQVENEPTNLFLRDHSGVKHALNKNGYDKFKIKAEDVGSHRDELMQLLESDPGRFIPNVILRPIVQDYLLPTFAYVGGPSEIAYFGQFKKVYEFFGIPEPLIVPRPFITVLEKKIKKAADKYSLTIEHIFKKRSGVVDEIASAGSEKSVSGEIELFSTNFRQQFDRIEKNLVEVDASLKGAAETAWDKIDKAVKVLKDKTADAEKRKNELTHSQLGKAVRHIFPNDQFQEREINALYYLNKYGPAFLDTIYEKMDVSGNGHQIIEL
jgi:bacillithiol biosynthesis cysteine-adding enzyme BshC